MVESCAFFDGLVEAGEAAGLVILGVNQRGERVLLNEELILLCSDGEGIHKFFDAEPIVNALNWFKIFST